MTATRQLTQYDAIRKEISMMRKEVNAKLDAIKAVVDQILTNQMLEPPPEENEVVGLKLSHGEQKPN